MPLASGSPSQPPPPGAPPLFVAHRGMPLERVENTIPSFQLAWERGSDAIEADFQLTRDQELVCFHDKDTGRLAGQSVFISQSSLAELKAIDLMDGSPIPSLQDVLETVPEGKVIYLEIKGGPSCLPPLLEALKPSRPLTFRVVVISFSAALIEAFKTARPDLEAYWICSFEPKGLFRRRPSFRSVLRTLQKTGADGLSTSRRIKEKETQALQQLGIPFHLWTINDLASARRFLALGAASITSDDAPSLAQRHANEPA